MDFLGIGAPELVAIVLILFLVLGPGDLVKLGNTLGRAVRSLRQSEAWHSFQDASRQLRSLPDNLAREAGIDEIQEEFKEQKAALDDLDRQIIAWTRIPQDKSLEEGEGNNGGDARGDS